MTVAAVGTQAPHEIIVMTEKALLALPEYSTSVPTGVTIGKRWRRHANWYVRDAPTEWWLGEYAAAPSGDPNKYIIIWRLVQFHQPVPPEPTPLEPFEYHAAVKHHVASQRVDGVFYCAPCSDFVAGDNIAVYPCLPSRALRTPVLPFDPEADGEDDEDCDDAVTPDDAESA